MEMLTQDYTGRYHNTIKLITSMYILPPGIVSRMEARIPPEFISPIAALVQLPGSAVSTYCKIAINDYGKILK
jgi:hypothetical protein